MAVSLAPAHAPSSFSHLRLQLIQANHQFVPLNPRPMLQQLVDQEVIIRLKWGQTEYTGRLVSVDSYMNIQLSGAEEFEEGKSKGVLGQLLIR